MSNFAISSIVLLLLFGGALLGMFLRGVVPEHHMSADSKDVVKLGMGLVATMAALVLSLLISSAKGSYDAQSNELADVSAKIILLDRTLSYYGPETHQARELLRNSVARSLDRIWSKTPKLEDPLDTPDSAANPIYEMVQSLEPKDNKQRSNQAQALSILASLAQTRWLMYEQRTTSISVPLLVILVSWLGTLFVSFGLFAPRNGTTLTSLFISALSVSAAILLIMELYSPYKGLIQVSSTPLRIALAHLGQ
jgi:hypothetical protein